MRIPIRAVRVSAILLPAVLAAVPSAHAADVRIKPGDQIVTIEVRNEAQARQLLDWDLDVWSHGVGVGPVDVHVSTAERARIDAAGMTYDVAVEDLPALYQASRPAAAARGGSDFDNYKSLDELIAFINALAAARPDLCEVLDVGDSVEGRDIWALHITGSGASPKPGILMHGLQHCREWITGSMVIYIADHLVNRYDTDPCVKAMVDGVDFYLIPCLNPDGYAFTWTEPNNEDFRLWRKNRRDNGDGTLGVDLNRNWGFQWGFNNEGSSNQTSSEVYRGTAPFSEPETAAIRDFVVAHPEIRSYMDYHNFGEQILWPWGYKCSPADDPARSRFDSVGRRMHELIHRVYGHDYDAGPICPTLYEANGASVDWNFGDQGLLAMTIELRPVTQNPGFLLAPQEIRPTCEENLPAILHLAEWATRDLLINPLSDPPASILADQPAALPLFVDEVNEAAVSGSAMMNIRTDPEAEFAALPLQPLGGGVFEATLPSNECGKTLEYFFTVAGDAGGAAVSPGDFDCTLPQGATYTTSVERKQLLFADDFERHLGWTPEQRAGGADPRNGFWERGVPVNDPAYQWDPPACAGGGGECYLTENQPGNSDVDQGAVSLETPLFDLTRGDVIIEYDYFLRITNTSGQDRLTVEISTNGGQSWTEIARHADNGGLTWHPHAIGQPALDGLGVILSSEVKMRFAARDGTPQTPVEAGLDNFRIYVTSCDFTNCGTVPGDLNSDSQVNGADAQGFVEAVLAGGFAVPCADVGPPFGVVSTSDVEAFVERLITP